MTKPFGILSLNKPAGWTSRDVVNRIERLLRTGKCGHAGTLDPLATGVLVVCVGRATRLIQYVQRLPKRYRAVFQFGRRSATDDTEGEVELVPDAPVPTREQVDAAFPQFVGDIQQRPPTHSAIKVDGRRAYDRARSGEEFELPARTVTVHQLQLMRYDYPELELEIVCGSGTYVRSLGRDLAAALGTVAVMSALERTAIGEFRVADAVALDDLAPDNVTDHLQPALAAVADLPRVELGDAQLTEIRHGRPIEMSACATGSAMGATGFASAPVAGSTRPNTGRASGTHLETTAEWAAVDAAGQLVGVLFEKYAGQLWPRINFTT